MAQSVSVAWHNVNRGRKERKNKEKTTRVAEHSVLKSCIDYLIFATAPMATELKGKRKHHPKNPNINLPTLGNPYKSSEHFRTRDSMSIRSFSKVLAYSDKLSISRVFCRVGTSSSASASQSSSAEVAMEEPKELVSSVIFKKQHRNRITSSNSEKPICSKQNQVELFSLKNIIKQALKIYIHF